MDGLKESDFSGARLNRPGTIAVAFVADWCGFCRRFLRIWQPFEPRSPVPLAVADASDDDGPLWSDFDIQVVPTIVVFRDGKPVWRKDSRLGVGLSEAALEEMARALAANP
jgi:thioredoxin 1